MDRTAFAKELLALARDLVGMEFDTKEEMEQYKKDHDVRPGTKMNVKAPGKKEPAKKESLPQKEDVENAFRDHLSRRDRTVTKNDMKSVIKGQFKGITDVGFDNVWNNLVEEKYLVPSKGGFKWEM